MNIKISNSNQPTWKVVNVKSHIPEALKKLDELAQYLYEKETITGEEFMRILDEE